MPQLPPEFRGGTEMVVAALARSMRHLDGVEVLIVTGSDQPHLGEDVEVEQFGKLDVRRIKRTEHEGYGLSVGRPRVQQVLDGLLRDEGVDVVHVNHWSSLTDQMLQSARAAGLAAGATMHDLWTTCPRFFRSPPAEVPACPGGTDRGACAHCCALGLGQPDDWCAEHLGKRDAALQRELAAAQFLTTPSRTSAERIARHLPWDASTIEVVPHGLLEPVKSDQSPAPRTPGAPIRIGTFGNLVEPKGVMLLVYACQGIPGVELHLYGPFLEDAFGQLVREKAAEFGVALTCHGRYSPAKEHPARGLDLAVFPSLCEETYGLVVEESLARKVPVIVSDRGALHERVGDGGIAVSVDEVGPLQRAIQGLVADDGAALDRIRERIPTEFATIGDAAQRFVALYQDALASR